MDAEKVIIHARFAPNGTIVEISERPAGLDPQDWFNFLSYRAADTYQALAGGRGVFRLDRASVDALKVESAAKAA
ncbi:hypothetical protein EZH22_04045 [Xanthobacter dioxanivorans]|uniref:Uncharacterized protein n=1 Tax=Xanthobacter dioxanivorans TaxID=2528964 RepID=A0A974PQL3_9HYPH|nr:hypothetical protein [Xanthobacter dioxanivorans]QRG07578.1 hypothetical protein EZH22_04045 [Xanthobacter dioxanivorans]